ncbi:MULTISPECIES: hypothetical protein [Bacillaceae]|uniref:hypothetical protein n=1 Tax=Bacillaceae TaxID=186817 RepID=UPI0011E97783|nr:MULTISPECIES: hypothetical protein [Bacillaceae]TYS40453.1 hypothetical protein FZC68_16730 [Bacillus pumilus]
MWELTLPQLTLYLKKCRKQREFTIKVHSAAYSGLFGGAGEVESNSSTDAETGDGEYEELDEEGLDFLAQVLG